MRKPGLSRTGVDSERGLPGGGGGSLGVALGGGRGVVHLVGDVSGADPATGRPEGLDPVLLADTPSGGAESLAELGPAGVPGASGVRFSVLELGADDGAELGGTDCQANGAAREDHQAGARQHAHEEHLDSAVPATDHGTHGTTEAAEAHYEPSELVVELGGRVDDPILPHQHEGHDAPEGQCHQGQVERQPSFGDPLGPVADVAEHQAVGGLSGGPD